MGFMLRASGREEQVNETGGERGREREKRERLGLRYRERAENMTGFGKTPRMGFFQKIEFDAWLISSIIELTRVQVLGRWRASLWRYSALFAIAPHPP